MFSFCVQLLKTCSNNIIKLLVKPIRHFYSQRVVRMILTINVELHVPIKIYLLIQCDCDKVEHLLKATLCLYFHSLELIGRKFYGSWGFLKPVRYGWIGGRKRLQANRGKIWRHFIDKGQNLLLCTMVWHYWWHALGWQLHLNILRLIRWWLLKRISFIRLWDIIEISIVINNLLIY